MTASTLVRSKGQGDEQRRSILNEYDTGSKGSSKASPAICKVNSRSTCYASSMPSGSKYNPYHDVLLLTSELTLARTYQDLNMPLDTSQQLSEAILDRSV